MSELVNGKLAVGLLVARVRCVGGGPWPLLPPGPLAESNGPRPAGEKVIEEDFVDPFGASNRIGATTRPSRDRRPQPLETRRPVINTTPLTWLRAGRFVDTGTPVEVIAVYNHRIVVRDANSRNAY
ncbi:MAG: hypothetical protein U1D30_03830 [Planctomycetota bacterium]